MSEAAVITTEDEFRERLEALLTAARRSGISVKRPWLCNLTAEASDYEVLITEVARSTR